MGDEEDGEGREVLSGVGEMGEGRSREGSGINEGGRRCFIPHDFIDFERAF